MLTHLLKGGGVFGWPLEFFNPRHFQEWKSRAAEEEAEDVVELMERRRTSPNGCFGIKVHYGDLRNVIATLGGRQLIDGYHFILLRRRDVLGQAISWVRAEQTRAWSSAAPELASPKYDRAAIADRLQLVVKHTGRWQHFMAETGKRPLELIYENVADRPIDAVTKVAEFLGIDLPDDTLSIHGPPLKIQRTSMNDEWRDRFVEEMRRFHVGAADKGMWNDSFIEEPFPVSLKRFLRIKLGGVRVGRSVRP